MPEHVVSTTPEYVTDPRTYTDASQLRGDPGSGLHTAEFYGYERWSIDPICYVDGVGWHLWSGKHWEFNPSGKQVHKLVQDYIKFRAAAHAGTPEGRKYSKAGLVKETVEKLELAFLRQHEQMDADPYVLNVQNGILNLLTGELEPHDLEMNHTKVTNAAYIDEINPVWTDFLDQVLPDKEVQAYLQQLIGLSLLGVVRERVLPIMIGGGTNGKTTVIEAVLYALGGYAMPVKASLLLTKDEDVHRASPATLDLRGMRFVATTETDVDAKLASATVKLLTGGDKLKARALYKHEIEFAPTHSIFMATNHMPVVDGSDEALFTRLRVIKFDQCFKDRMDNTLADKFRLNTDSVLTWAIRGLQKYLENGYKLDTPKSVMVATKEYKQDSDVTGRFVEECLVFGPGTEAKGDIARTLAAWQSDIEPKYRITSQRLSREFKERGVTDGMLRIDGKPTRVWNGVTLKEREEMQQ